MNIPSNLQIEAALSGRAHARLGQLLSRAQCEAVRSLWAHEKLFRSTIDMARFRFGSGTYKYFAQPIPELVAGLRKHWYEALQPAANIWAKGLDLAVEYPATHEEFLGRCHSAGQTRPTPLLLRYEEGGYNCLHQDIYGPVVFPFQVIICLSEAGREYAGGELMLVEQRPRAQSVGTALALAQGECCDRDALPAGAGKPGDLSRQCQAWREPGAAGRTICPRPDFPRRRVNALILTCKGTAELE